MIGRSISHYKIIEKLGEGGMGVVYKAEDTKLGRPVALKFLPPHLLSSETDRQRFLSEAQTAARLSHPGICTVHEIDTADGHTFIAMEYVPGEDLAHEIASGPLEFNRAARISLDLCGALREAHAAGVIHRDIKPSNVMISDKGRTVLLDFGVARLRGDPKLTRTGTTVGTSGYMSPEQVRGETVDHRTDIWSLGVVLYQMLTGALPFKADHEAAVLYAIANEQAPPISDIRPTVPAALQEIVEKALEKDLARRYHNIDAFQADLEVFLGRQDGKTTPTSVRLGIEEVRRERLVRAVWAVLLVAVIAAGVWLWPRGKPEAPSPIPAARDAATSAKTPDHRASIAVLPLANMSSESGNEFFSDGMTEEIITQLAQIKALKVISRTSVMQYKNTTKKLPVIAGELGVENILEGSVVRAGDRVRISVQLIDGATDEHLWAESYESDLSDVLALQGRVAAAVAKHIQVQLTPEETARLAASAVVDERAYDLYLRGRYHWNKRTPDGIRSAMGYYQEAIAVDPGYALAYAGMAETYAVAVSWAFMPTGGVCAQARGMAEKAVSIDPTLSAAHAVLGLIAEVCDWEWEEAERHLRRAIELGPGVAINHQWYAQLLAATGRHSEAAAEARIASEYDPRSASLNGAAGLVLGCNGEYREAIALFDKVRVIEPESAPLFFYESAVLYRMGEPERSAKALIRYFELTAETDQDRRAVAALRDALDKGGVSAYNETSLALLRKQDAEEPLLAYYVAVYFARTGEADSAMVWLERSYRRREGSLHAILTGAGSFAALHSDSRFIDLLSRMGLPQAK